MSIVKRKDPTDVIFVNSKSQVVIPNELPLKAKHKEVFLSNKNFPQIKLMDKNHVAKEIRIYLNQIIMDKGVNMDSEETAYLKQRIVKDIISQFDHFTLEEVRLAFYYGVRSEFGKYYGINAVSCHDWLKAFKEQLQADAYKACYKYLPDEEEDNDFDQKQLDIDTRDIICDHYFNLCVNGNYDYYDINGVGYDFLDRLNLISFSEEEMKDIFSESRQNYKNHLKKKNRKLRDRGQTVQQINLERAFGQLQDMSNPTFEYQIKVGAKRIAIFRYLYRLAKEEIDLKELIDAKIKEYDYEKK